MNELELHSRKREVVDLGNHLVLMKFAGNLKDEKGRVTAINSTSVKFDTQDFILGNRSALWAEDANMAFPSAITIDGDYTLDAWLKMTPVAVTTPNQVIGWSNRAANNHLSINTHGTRGAIGFSDGGTTGFYSPALAVPANEWFHAAWIKHKNKRWACVNGKRVTDEFAATIPTVFGHLLGLKWGSSNQNGYLGKINQLALVDRAKWVKDFDPPTEFYVN